MKVPYHKVPLMMYRLQRNFQRDAADLQRYQNKKLRAIVQHCARRVPYYHRLFKERHLDPSSIRTVDDLEKLPILTTWEGDGGPFITMGQVYTQSLDGELVNLGMYRLQMYDSKHLGMHWQIHKDSSHFFDQYQREGKKMPVSIALGGDPLYTWCATAPLPYGVNELLLYGLITKKPARLVKSLTTPLYIPILGGSAFQRGWTSSWRQLRRSGMPFPTAGCS